MTPTYVGKLPAGSAQMLTPNADRVYVHPAIGGRRSGPPQANPRLAPPVSTLQRLDAVLWYERELLELLVEAHACACRADDPEIARLSDERRTTSLLRLVESAQLADELGLPAGSQDVAACLDGGWSSVLTEHEIALGRLSRQLAAASGGMADGPR